jgi:hypothetical protein
LTNVHNLQEEDGRKAKIIDKKLNGKEANLKIKYPRGVILHLSPCVIVIRHSKKDVENVDLNDKKPVSTDSVRESLLYRRNSKRFVLKSKLIREKELQKERT